MKNNLVKNAKYYFIDASVWNELFTSCRRVHFCCAQRLNAERHIFAAIEGGFSVNVFYGTYKDYERQLKKECTLFRAID